ncbi:MAG: DUF4091 domain-containing protein [Clostridia bacterium]|nr:DUF4091 domain-containing protein [Clostridia bacterium]
MKVFSSLERLFGDGPLPERERLEYYAVKGGSVCFQAVCSPARGSSLKIDAPADMTVDVFVVGDVPVEKDQDGSGWLLRGGKAGEYPDVLFPLGGGGAVKLPDRGGTLRLWFEARVGESAKPGIYDVKIYIKETDGESETAVRVRVPDLVLPPQKLKFTNWFHCDCLATHYGCGVFSPEHWRIVGNYMRFAAAHGMNMILTPLFTPPLDTAVGSERPTAQLVGVKKPAPGRYEFDFSLLDRWIDLSLASGMEYFELSHLFTQWGARHAPKVIASTPSGEKRIFGWETRASGETYRRFLSQLAPQLMTFLDNKGVIDRCRLHVSDEPGRGDLASYSRASGAVHELFPGLPTFDALSDPEFFERGLVDIPVPIESRYGDFSSVKTERWAYYCGGPNENDWLNRLIYFPGARIRGLGAALWQARADGFLHWGYDFWYTKGSTRAVDPYKETTAGSAFPAGDGFSVYPGEGGEPVPSVRLKNFRDGLTDMRVLDLLESMVGRKKAEELLASSAGTVPSFNDYPRSSDFYDGLAGLIG